MIKVEGHIAFVGKATITPNDGRTPYVLRGRWLFDPEKNDNNGMWFLNGNEQYPWGTSFYPEMVSNLVEAIG